MNKEFVLELLCLIFVLNFVWQLTDQSVYRNGLEQQSSPIRKIAWSPDGNIIAVGTNSGIRIYNSDLVEQSFLNVDFVGDLAWSFDSNRLAIGVYDENLNVSVQLWDISSSSQLLSLVGQPADFLSIAWKPDGSQIAVSTGNVEIWDTTTGSLITTLDTGAAPQTNIVVSVAWSPDGTKIAGANSNGTVSLWEASSGILINNLSAPESLGTIAWSANSMMVAASGSDTVYIWDISTHSLAKTLSAGGITVRDLDWKSNIIASANSVGDGSSLIQIWDVSDEDLLSTINLPSLVLTLALNPSATQLVYGGDGGTLESIFVGESAASCNPIQTISAGDVTGFINAINTANSNPDADVIGLEAGTYIFTTAHIPLNALPAITSEITIVGNGAALSRQAGSPPFGFFQVSAGGSLTLENLTLNGGDVGNDTGGALVNEGGMVTLNNVTFSNNHANTEGND